MTTYSTTNRAQIFWGHLLTSATLVFLISGIGLVEAVIPSVELSLFTSNNDDAEPTVLLVSQAFFGPEPPVHGSRENDNASPKSLVSPPENNLFLCQNPSEIEVDETVLEFTKDTWIAVPRGGCTYEHKTWVAQSIYEAHGVIIYNTLGSRYSFNETEGNILWPVEYHDYDCDNARAEIPSNELHFFSSPDEAKSSGKATNGPYDFQTNDPLLTGDTVDNLCKIHDANDLRNCPSKRCLVAHKDTADETASATDTTTVCCAWDILLNPYPDPDLDRNVTINIPTLFATMEQWGVISSALDTSPSLSILAYKRWSPTFNFSFVLIVLLGGFVAAFAAFRSADDYHLAISKLWQPKSALSGPNTGNRNPVSGSQQQDRLVPPSLAEESLELEPIHALLFLIMSSISLFILFFFKVGSFIYANHVMSYRSGDDPLNTNGRLRVHSIPQFNTMAFNSRYTTLPRSCTHLVAPMRSFKSSCILSCQDCSARSYVELPARECLSLENVSFITRKILEISQIGISRPQLLVTPSAQYGCTCHSAFHKPVINMPSFGSHRIFWDSVFV